MSEFFRFEDKTRDFPYYKHNPRLSKTAWIVLLVLVPVSLLAYSLISLKSEFIGSLAFCLMMLIPLLYFSNWDYSLMFRKPTRKEIGLAVLLFIGYMIYALAIGEFLDLIGQGTVATPESMGTSLETIISLVFSMMGEELMKFIPLMFFMRLIYKFTENRKASVVISTIIILIYFGLLHFEPGVNTIIFVLLTQGLGSIFELYGYIKTKNVFVPYISHLLTDALIFATMLIWM